MSISTRPSPEFFLTIHHSIISLLTTYLDLTALSELARTCRQVRANLLQYRELLISRALRCENEDADPAQRLGSALHASHDVWNTYGQNGVKVGRITSGKVGACARDMVGACRGCGKVICRVCIPLPFDSPLFCSALPSHCFCRFFALSLLKDSRLSLVAPSRTVASNNHQASSSSSATAASVGLA